MATSSVGMANLPYFGVLPMGISNYGGDIQVYNVSDYATPFYNVFNQQAIDSLSAPFQGVSLQLPQPVINQEMVDQLADAMYQPVIANLAQSNVGSVAGTISATKAKLNSLLQTQGISDEDKKKVKALLERLDEQEKKLNELKNTEGLTNQEIYDRSKEIEKAMRDIAAETAQLNIKPQSSSSSNESQGASSQQSQGAGFFVAPEYAGKRAELEAKYQALMDVQTGGVRSAMEIAQEFRDAIEGWGTDDEKFEAICSQINKDNVMDLMLAYNRFQSTEHGESFMKAFMGDADHGQKAKYGKQIANALKAKAVEVGVYDECKDDFAKIYDELGDWFISNDIAENFDNIIEKIAVAMDQPEYARPYEK